MTGMNFMKVGALFTAFMLLFAGVGSIIGYYLFGGAWMPAMVLFLVIAGVINLVAYYWSDKIVLRSYRARIVGRNEAPRLYGIVQNVAMKADMPMPRVAVIPEECPNAFATGRNEEHAVVAATAAVMVAVMAAEIISNGYVK